MTVINEINNNEIKNNTINIICTLCNQRPIVNRYPDPSCLISGKPYQFVDSCYSCYEQLFILLPFH